MLAGLYNIIVLRIINSILCNKKQIIKKINNYSIQFKI